METARTLTNDQVDYLFKFCKKHYVHHYDLQVELVDHLANAIEEKMTANKQLSFEAALDNVYASFGISGFAAIVAARTATLKKQSRKMHWELFLSYFTWPKITMTTCLLTIFLCVGHYLDAFSKELVVSMWSIFLFIFEMYIITKGGNAIKKQTNKLLMVEVSNFNFFMLIMLTVWSDSPFRAFDFFAENIVRRDMHYPEYVFTIVIQVLLFLVLFYYRKMQKTVQQKARVIYPAAFAKNN